MPDLKPWNLVADIGGTNARFAVHDIETDELQKVIVLSVAEYPTFMDALLHLLSQIHQEAKWEVWPHAACLAVACPVDRELISFTNSSWKFTRTELAQTLNQVPVEVINDFSAVAYSIPALHPHEWHQIGGLEPHTDKPVAILGPGTGLGVCTLVPVNEGFKVMDGEGGHIDFAPVNNREIAVLRLLQKRYKRVSIERLLSGAGIVNIYQSICALESQPVIYQSAQQITEAALTDKDDLSIEALSIFCQVLGSTASNLALISGAKGGVYIAGGIAPRFVDFINNSDFRKRFEDKGRFEFYVKDIPIRIILKQHLGLFGAVQRIKLDEEIKS
jgi:glucokinase